MSGSGNIDVLCLCRHLHSRIGQNSHVGYGSHMATHMSIGLLFLGGGRYTLATNREAIGAMLCAFFPKFPTHSNDNRLVIRYLNCYELFFPYMVTGTTCKPSGICMYWLWNQDLSFLKRSPVTNSATHILK